MVINEKMCEIKKFSFLQFTFYSLTFVGTVFVEVISVEVVFIRTFTSILSSHIITESPIILPKYLPFSQVRVLGFQI